MIPHGTESKYTNHSCRCADCRDAWRLACAKRRALRSVVGRTAPEWLEHGTVSTYTNWGCRCLSCTEASRLAYRRKKAAS